MDLYLIRHADALALGEKGISRDEDRPLSETGEKQAQIVALGLSKRGIVLDKVVTSPLVRAHRTAEIMLQNLPAPAPELVITEALLPQAKSRKLSRVLLKQTGQRIALVGHLPHIAEWAGWLIGAKKVQIDLAKAGVAYITCGEAPRKGTGVLQWLVTPEWLA